MAPPVGADWQSAHAPAQASLAIASIQKLSRPAGLAALDSAASAAEPFDYCVIDEVHHAEAPSYRRVLARLKSSFTLGLTATPERTDGVDVATLFDDILAAQATIGDGIAEGSLVPFRYRGLKDDVDFERIPWRNGRFDVGELQVALENSARMERLWAEWQATPAGRTLVFCCSRRHAVFARDWLKKRGVAAAAVFSDSPAPIRQIANLPLHADVVTQPPVGADWQSAHAPRQITNLPLHADAVTPPPVGADWQSAHAARQITNLPLQADTPPNPL
jgi:superfamily II DNA or RNA helicase